MWPMPWLHCSVGNATRCHALAPSRLPPGGRGAKGGTVVFPADPASLGLLWTVPMLACSAGHFLEVS